MLPPSLEVTWAFVCFSHFANMPMWQYQQLHAVYQKLYLLAREVQHVCENVGRKMMGKDTLDFLSQYAIMTTYSLLQCENHIPKER
jgi:hypothetical protein